MLNDFLTLATVTCNDHYSQIVVKTFGNILTRDMAMSVILVAAAVLLLLITFKPVMMEKISD